MFFASLSSKNTFKNIDYLEEVDKQIKNIKDGKFLTTYSWSMQRTVFF